MILPLSSMLLGIVFFSYCEALESASNQNPPNISTTISPINTNHNTVTIGISQETVNTIHLSVSNKLITLQKFIVHTYETGRDQAYSITQWISDNKLKCTFGVLFLGYTYLHYKFAYLKYQLLQQHHWSLWNCAASLEDLFSMPQKMLGESIIREAQLRYTCVNEPDNFITPLVSLLKDIETEKLLLQQYINLCAWIQTLSLSKIMWHDQDFVQTCQKRLERLAFIRAVFVNWMTDYKLAHTHANA